MMPRLYIINYHRGLKKNPNWGEDHPDLLARYSNRGLAIWINYFLGILMIIYLSHLAISEHTPLAMTKAFKLSVIVFMVSVLIEEILFLRFYKTIPSPDSRSAQLTPRSPRDHVPMTYIYTGIVILLSILCFYVHAYVTGSMPSEVALRLLTHLVSVLLVFSVAYLLMRYRPALWDKLLGETTRKYESYLFVFGLYFVALVNIYVILRYHFHIQLIDMNKTWIIFFASLLTQLIFVFMCNIKEWKQLAGEKPGTILRSS